MASDRLLKKDVSPQGPELAAAYQVRVLDRAIDILEAFTPQRRDLNIREIVEATGLNRSTAIRLAANLERRGLLQRHPTTGRYRLGHRLFEMGNSVYAGTDSGDGFDIWRYSGGSGWDNVASGGHLLMEETISAHVPLYGDFFRCARRLRREARCREPRKFSARRRR